MKTSIATAEQYTWGDNCLGWHLLKADALSIIQELIPAGAAEQLHYHDKAQQFFFILSGTATFEIDGAEHVVAAQEGIHIPPGARHRISNRHGGDLKFLLVSQPTTRGDRTNLP